MDFQRMFYINQEFENWTFDWVRLIFLLFGEFDFVRLPNSIELNPPIEFDWNLVRFTMPGISTNGKQDVLKQPEANTDLLDFSVLSYYKSSVKKISLYLLLHFRIRIIVLTCPDINKSARNHLPKSCVPTKSHKSQWCNREANIISIEIFKCVPILDSLFPVEFSLLN